MLRLLTGKTGSGKSYQAVSFIMEDLEADKKVFTNIRISVDYPNYNYLDELQLKEFLSFIDDTFSSVDNLDDKKDEMKETEYFDGNFYIDEAHLVGFRSKTDAILNWLTLQRHFNQDITVITQVATNLHRDYLTMFHTHIDMIPPNKRLSKSSMGYREFDSFKGDRLKTQFFKPDLKLFEIYNSGNVEVGMSKDVFKLVGLLAFLVVIGFVLWSVKNTFIDNHKLGEQNITETNITVLPTNIPLSTVGSNEDNSTSFFADAVEVLCSTVDGCYYNAQTYPFNSFIMTVLSNKKFKKKTVARSSKGWELIRFTFKD